MQPDEAYPVSFFDNGKTFKAAAKSSASSSKMRRFKNTWLIKEVSMDLNIEHAPWWGGVFEQIVKSTKCCLRKIVGRANFSLDELLTAVVEIEAIINSQP